MDGRTDRQTDGVKPIYPPNNFVVRGYNKYGPGLVKYWGNYIWWMLRSYPMINDLCKHLKMIKKIRNWLVFPDGWGISCEIALMRMSMDLADDKSTLVQVMAWCRQATSLYLSQCWPRSMTPCGATRPHWANWSQHFVIIWVLRMFPSTVTISFNNIITILITLLLVSRRNMISDGLMFRVPWHQQCHWWPIPNDLTKSFQYSVNSISA